MLAFKTIVARVPSSFLKLLTAADATAQGINLSDKVRHLVYKTLQELSSVDRVKLGSMLYLGDLPKSLERIQYSEILRTLKSLMSDRLAAELFIIRFIDNDKRLEMYPIFLSQPESGSLNEVYDLIIDQSAEAIRRYIQVMKPVSAEAFERDLDSDYRIPPSDPVEWEASIVDLFKCIALEKFDIYPSSRMIALVTQDIKDSLVKTRNIKEIIGYGAMPVKNDEILMRWQTAETFLLERLVAHYKKNRICRRDLESIRLEESIYHEDKSNPPVTVFTVKRAASIKKVIDLSNMASGTRAQGQMTLETIRQFADLAEPLLKDEFDRKNRQKYNDIKEALMNPNIPWMDAIAFFKENDLEDMNSDTWSKLVDDNDLVYASWEFPEGTIHGLVRKDEHLFRELVKRMNSLPQQRHWQILLLKALIEEAEKDLPELFKNKDFVKEYGKILRLAYINYIPFFYRFFIYLGWNLFQDRAFQIAKGRIRSQQASLASRNNERYDKEQKEKKQLQKKKQAELIKIENKNKVIDELDEAYFSEGIYPTVSVIKNRIKDLTSDSFYDIMRNFPFQYIKTGNDPGIDNQILMYPLDHEWRSVSARLLTKMNTILEQHNTSENLDNEFIEQTRVIQKFLEKNISARAKETDEDPYTKLEKAIKQNESRPYNDLSKYF